MKFLTNISLIQTLFLLANISLISCRNNSIDVINFEAEKIRPGRVEQKIFTSYSLKFLIKEDSIFSNSFRILYNNELEITPIVFNQNSKSTYMKSDTVHLAFSIQNEFNSNHSYVLVYNNSKKNINKKLNQPQLKIKTNIPN